MGDFNLHYSSMEDFVKAISYRNKHNLDTFVCVWGSNGVGKTVLVIQLCLLGDKTYSIIPERIMNKPTYKELSEDSLKRPKGSYIHLDDCGELFYKRNFATKEQKDMNVFFMRSRKFIKNTFLCIPDFNDLDSYFRDNRVAFQILVPIRGRALIYQADTRGFGIPKWHMDEDKRIMEGLSKGKYKQDMTDEEYLSICRKMHGYCGEFSFNDLNPEQDLAYRSVVDWYVKRDEEANKEAEKEQEVKEDESNKLLLSRKKIDMVNNMYKKGISINDIASICETKESTVERLLRKASLISV